MSQTDVQEVKRPAEDMEDSGQSHRLSIAIMIGLTIGLMGLVLVLYGLFGAADYRRSDGIDVDLWWGLVMVGFGVVMSVGGYISERRRRQSAS